MLDPKSRLCLVARMNGRPKGAATLDNDSTVSQHTPSNLFSTSYRQQGFLPPLSNLPGGTGFKDSGVALEPVSECVWLSFLLPILAP